MSEGVVEPKQSVHWLVKVLVVFHLFACLAWSIPNPSDDVLSGKLKPKGTDALLVANKKAIKDGHIVGPYLLSTGFWQYWDMFSPNPSQTDFWGSAMVEFKDGTRTDAGYPRVKNYGMLEKYVMERHRKFFERAHLVENAWLWPDFAQRIALLNASDRTNPPTAVLLFRNFQYVVRHDAKDKTEKPYEKYQYFTYSVDQDRLAKAKGWR
jgi:hypothetical protein